MMAAKRSTVIARACSPRAMSAFWQYAQRKGQPAKNTVPLPSSPEIGGSSQKCSAARATIRRPSAPQSPHSPAARFAPQPRGHSRQECGSSQPTDFSSCISNPSICAANAAR